MQFPHPNLGRVMFGAGPLPDQREQISSFYHLPIIRFSFETFAVIKYFFFKESILNRTFSKTVSVDTQIKVLLTQSNSDFSNFQEKRIMGGLGNRG